MANNVQVTQGSGTTFKTTDNAGVHTGHVNVDAIADGGDVALGAKADAAATTDTGTFSLIALIKRHLDRTTNFIGPKLDTINTTIQSESIDTVAHDADATSANPLLVGGYASAAAPADVSADGDAVRGWRLRNGAAAVQVTAAGALVGGDASNGLDVDVTRVPTDPFGANADAASASGSISAKLRQIATNGIPVTAIPNDEYETVAASATDQILGATGAVGDYLAGVLIVPATTSPGAVSIKDGNGSAITVFTGGASSVSNLVPFFVPLGIKTINATTPGWKVTTGTNVSVIGVGNFT